MFELFEDADGKWRWRLLATNGEILATSEAYEGGEKAARDGIVNACNAVDRAKAQAVMGAQAPKQRPNPVNMRVAKEAPVKEDS